MLDRSVVVSVVCITISAIAVALRFICKHAQKKGFHMDDFWILFCVFAGWTADGALVWASLMGRGGKKDMGEILLSASKNKAELLRNYFTALSICWTFYLVASFTVKMSLLALYRLIFDMPLYRKIALAIMIASTLWFVGAIASSSNTHVLALGIVEVVLDVATVLLPLRVVAGLRVPTHKKVGLVFIFLLGGFTVGTGIARVKLMYQFSKYVQFREAGIWSNIHIMTAHVCACLPVYTPLWQLVSHLSTRIVTFYNSKRPTSLLPSFVRDVDGAEGGVPRTRRFFVSRGVEPLSSFGEVGGKQSDGTAKCVEVVEVEGDRRKGKGV